MSPTSFSPGIGAVNSRRIRSGTTAAPWSHRGHALHVLAFGTDSDHSKGPWQIIRKLSLEPTHTLHDYENTDMHRSLSTAVGLRGLVLVVVV